MINKLAAGTEITTLEDGTLIFVNKKRGLSRILDHYQQSVVTQALLQMEQPSLPTTPVIRRHRGKTKQEVTEAMLQVLRVVAAANGRITSSDVNKLAEVKKGTGSSCLARLLKVGMIKWIDTGLYEATERGIEHVARVKNPPEVQQTVLDYKPKLPKLGPRNA